MNELTLEQKACNYQTMRHIERVRNLLNAAAIQLLKRGEAHDQSKLSSPEVEAFTEHTPKLAAATYDSPDYHKMKRLMKPALDHHYAKNAHHPEHWKNGVDDMSLFDLLEMFIDWKASSERHNDGNILRSIELNADRFRMSPQLIRIFENTAKTMEGA
jgi:hypothetical protein